MSHPPLILSIGYHNDSTLLILENDTHHVPITLTKEEIENIDGEWDYTIEFELFNKSKSDLKIKDILIKVLSISTVESIKYYIPANGTGRNQIIYLSN